MDAADLKKVKSGEKFAPTAPTWNAFVDAALANRQRQVDFKTGNSLRISLAGIVPVKNSTGADINEFTILSLDTLLITPTDNINEFKFRPPVFSGIALISSNLSNPFAIMQEPLKTGFIGMGMIAGVTPVSMIISDESHSFAELAESGLVSASSGIARILWKESGTGTKWAIIHFPAGGGSGTAVKWAKITAITDANHYTASIWPDRNEANPTETNMALYVSDIADTLAVNDWIPVQASNRENIDYENIQQLGLL